MNLIDVYREITAELDADPVIGPRRTAGKHEEIALVLTPRQAGRLLSVPTKTIVQLCREGVLRAKKVGRHWRIPREAIAEFFDVETPGSPEQATSTPRPAPARSRPRRREQNHRQRFLRLLGDE